MVDHELFPTHNLNCEVTASDISYDFDDTSRFRKIEFPEQAGITANSLLQLVPAQLAADTASNLYVLRFPKGIQGVLMNLHQGGQSTTMIDAAGNFAGSIGGGSKRGASRWKSKYFQPETSVGHG